MTANEQKIILVVEDDLDIRELLTEILTDEGYLVISAENGKIGLDYLISCQPNKRPDCIILDLMMPVMNGLQVLESLQKDYPHDLAQIPVIVATAKGSPKEDLQNLPINVKKIRKPMDVNELIEIVSLQCQGTSTN